MTRGGGRASSSRKKDGKQSGLKTRRTSAHSRRRPGTRRVCNPADLLLESARQASMNHEPARSKHFIIKLLTRKSGVTLETMIEATGWLPHTTRAALTGLRKRGYAVLLERQDGKPSLYRIASARDRVAG